MRVNLSASLKQESQIKVGGWGYGGGQVSGKVRPRPGPDDQTHLPGRPRKHPVPVLPTPTLLLKPFQNFANRSESQSRKAKHLAASSLVSLRSASATRASFGVNHQLHQRPMRCNAGDL